MNTSQKTGGQHMEITVIEKPKRFWLAKKSIDEEKYSWEPAIGHEIQVGVFRFFVAPIDNEFLNVSEVTTGLKVFEMKLTTLDLLFTETKEETMEFYRGVIGVKLKSIIDKMPNFKERLNQEREKQKAFFGDMPEIDDFDETIIKAPFNEFTN